MSIPTPKWEEWYVERIWEVWYAVLFIFYILYKLLYKYFGMDGQADRKRVCGLDLGGMVKIRGDLVRQMGVLVKITGRYGEI